MATDRDTARERLLLALDVLECAARDRSVLAELDRDEMERLVRAAGRVCRPDRASERALTRELQRRRREAKRRAAEAVLETTGIRADRRASVFVTPLIPPSGGGEQPRTVGALPEDRNCYICKAAYRDVHFFYDALCPDCAAFNYAKRSQSADLRGRVALVTGARVKIGYQAAILLLRAGARVVVTTRFPRDAAARYAREPDFASWSDRLTVYGLDLRHAPAVETFAAHLVGTYDRLDFVLNNACQTVRRPPGFYQHLMDGEAAPLPSSAMPLIEEYESIRARRTSGLRSGTSLAAKGMVDGIVGAVGLSQVALLPEDASGDASLFPHGRLDADLQQVDLRGTNSWRLSLAEVSTVELLEVQLVNAVAPFVLNRSLKPLMLRHPGRDKHIVNVSAMEGQFYRTFKTDRHPHTNMAKAALNMMTRTSAADYVRDGIHMNSVDTGWITDEDPAEIAARKRAEGFEPPLDIVDGAARICDPIFSGLNSGEHVWGQFLKDYKPAPW